MGVFNFTRGGFTGSVGVHTGRNWKGKNVLSPKTAPAYSRTEKQAVTIYYKLRGIQQMFFRMQFKSANIKKVDSVIIFINY